MVEMRVIVRVILALILIVVVVTGILYIVFGLKPDVSSVFYPGRETLVRYYACSLAICTRGCEDGSAVEKICLEKDLVTEDCNLWCDQLCEREFGDCPAGECCGPLYNLTLTLEKEAPLMGCYAVEGTMGDTSERELPELSIGGFISRVMKYFTGSIVATLVNHYYAEAHYWMKKLPYMAEPSEVNDCFYLPTPEYYPGGRYYLGIIHDHIDVSLGAGSIILDPAESHEKFGCYDEAVPLNPDDLIHRQTMDAPGFYRCKFVPGSLKIWAEEKEDGCADVRINSTLKGDWLFTIECTEPMGPLGCLARVKPEETAEYTIKIENYLGTGSEFDLGWGESTKKVDCKFFEDSEEISSIYVENGDFKEFKLSCSSTETGDYTVLISAERPGKFPETTSVEFRVVDFDFWVTPEEEDEIGKSESKTYTIWIKNELGKDVDFILSKTITVEDGGSLDCELAGSLHVGDGETDNTPMVCNKDHDANEGKYKISVEATGDGITEDPEIRYLSVTECEGEIKLEIPEGVESGMEFSLKAYDVKGCSDRGVDISVVYPELIVGQCAPHTWDGEECEIRVTANTPGTYTVYAFIDKNKDEDTDDDGEMNSKTLQIDVDPPGSVTEVGNDEGCFYHCCESCGLLGTATICDRCCGFMGWSVCDCKNCCDPQTCARWNSLTEDWYRVADTSNICCISDGDEHSSGPGSVSCLTPDTLNDNTKTENFWWELDVTNPRNLLVPENYLVDSTQVHPYAYLESRDCSSPDDCTGGPGAPSELSSAECDGSRCQLPCQYLCGGTPCASCRYSSWIFIRIAPEGESRPVYGIFGDVGLDDFVDVFLHKKTGEWIKVGYFDEDNSVLYPTNPHWVWERERPRIWSWGDIDSMLLGLTSSSAYIYYIGLMTKGEATGLEHPWEHSWTFVPYCTDGRWIPDYENNAKYYRTVDDGKICYWGLDCPTAGSGWIYEGLTDIVGPFREGVGRCSCDPFINSGAHCDEGYCEIVVDGTRFCYYNVRCANGGWRNPDLGEPNGGFKKCNLGEVCGPDGGTCSG